MELQTAIAQRRSVSQFAPDGQISKEDIERMIEAATLAPSSYNLQHWHFLVILDPLQKKALRDTAYEQQKVEDAAAAVVVLGNMEAHLRGEEITADFIAKGYMEKAEQAKALDIINGYYSNEENRRMEAVRGASLAAMNLMLAAEGLEYGTCPMAGFDPDAMRRSFNIPPHLLPILIIAIGTPAPEPRPRKMRYPVEEVTVYDRF